MTHESMSQPRRNDVTQPDNSQATTPAAPERTWRVPVQLGVPLTDLDQAWRLAAALAASNLLPDNLTRNARAVQANITVILLYGAELGLAPMQSLQEIYVVHGRPQISGRLWLALVRQAGHRVEKIKHTDEECTIRITRGDTGESWEETFTIEDARRAGLDTKDIYKMYPRRMLLWRAVANCATVICPEVAMGFGAEPPEEEPWDVHAALARAVDARGQHPAGQEPPSHDIAEGETVEDTPVSGDTSQEGTGGQPDVEGLRHEVLAIAAEHEAAKSPPGGCASCGGSHEGDCPKGEDQ